MNTVTIDTRPGVISYLDTSWKPVAPDKATLAKVVFEDGGAGFYTLNEKDLRLAFDANQIRDEFGRWTDTGAASNPKTRTALTNAEQIIREERAAPLWAATFEQNKLIAQASAAYFARGEEGLALFIDAHGGPGEPTFEQGREGIFEPAENLAAAARLLTEKVRDALEVDGTRFRGLSSETPLENLEMLNPGDSITMPRLTSFSDSRARAARYADLGGRHYKYELRIEGPMKGFHTDDLTQMTHEEVITQGKFEVMRNEPGDKIRYSGGKIVTGFGNTVKFERIITLKQVGVF